MAKRGNWNIMIVTIDELRTLLREGTVNFEYTKRDGTERFARGTLKVDHIPEGMRPLDGSTYKANNLRYFDLDKSAWRSISGDTKDVKVL